MSGVQLVVVYTHTTGGPRAGQCSVTSRRAAAYVDVRPDVQAG